MAFNTGNLVPTPVMRSDGHMTTVHKKASGGSSAALGKLASAKPSAGNKAPAAVMVHPNDAKMLKVAWRGDKLNKSDLLHHMGYFPDASESGAMRMSHGDIYDYLKIGIPLDEAAYLNEVMPLSDWSKETVFKESTPGTLSFIQHGKRDRPAHNDAAIDFMRENGIAPRIAQKMLYNGFANHHIGGALSPEETERLFIRFKYQPSVDDTKETNASVAIDALVDGRLPFEAFKRGFDRPLLTDAVDSLYPRGKRWNTELSDSDRKYILAHPEEIVPTIYTAHKTKADFATAYVAVKEFGSEACELYAPQVMASVRSDGSFVGVDGAKRIAEFKADCNSLLHGSAFKIESYDPTVFCLNEGYNTSAELAAVDVLDLLDAGAHPAKIIEMSLVQKLTTQQMLAVIRGDSVASLAEGWL